MTTETKIKQQRMVLDHLMKHGSITSMEAIDKYGCTRLSSQIYALRHKKHYAIRSEWEDGINRFGSPTRYVRYYWDEDGVDGEQVC